MNARLRLSWLLVGAALLAATSCGSLKAPGGNSTTSSGPTQASADPRDDLKKAFTAQLAAKTFRARMEMSLAPKGTHNEMEFVSPDRFHVSIIGPPLMQGRSIRQEMIIVGKDTFTKTGDMAWQKTTMDSDDATMATTIGEMAKQFRSEDVAQRMMKYEEVKFVGADTLEGQPVRVYQYKLKSAQGQTTGKIWISASDDLPRKIEQESGSETARSKLTTTYYDYNANINIEPPV